MKTLLSYGAHTAKTFVAYVACVISLHYKDISLLLCCSIAVANTCVSQRALCLCVVCSD